MATFEGTEVALDLVRSMRPVVETLARHVVPAILARPLATLGKVPRDAEGRTAHLYPEVAVG